MFKNSLVSSIQNVLKDRRGATAIEYGLIAALISVAIASLVGTIGTDLGTTFTNISTKLTGG